MGGHFQHYPNHAHVLKVKRYRTVDWVIPDWVT